MTHLGTATNPLPAPTDTFGRTAVLFVILFAAVLLIGVLVSLRYAHGWAEVLSDGAAATIPMAVDSLAALISALVTAVGVVWLYIVRLAR